MSNKQPISTFLGIAAGVILATNGSAAVINVPGNFGAIQAALAPSRIHAAVVTLYRRCCRVDSLCNTWERG